MTGWYLDRKARQKPPTDATFVPEALVVLVLSVILIVSDLKYAWISHDDLHLRLLSIVAFLFGLSTLLILIRRLRKGENLLQKTNAMLTIVVLIGLVGGLNVFVDVLLWFGI